MAEAGQKLDLGPLGIQLTFTQTAVDTGGELLEYEVTGRPRGFLTQAHVHPRQSETLTVISGAMSVRVGSADRIVTAGNSVEIPIGTPHRAVAAGADGAQVRAQLKPALRTEELLERLAAYASSGDVTKGGYLKPLPAARTILDFSEEGYPTRPPVAVQRSFARLVTSLADRDARRGREYVFVDEWDVTAPREAVFPLLADARTYPTWWRSVYVDIDCDGPPELGRVSRHRFKGRLPYELRTTSTIVEYVPPERVASDVVGDLNGHGVWTLTPVDGGTHVRFDWQVFADRPLLRRLTPVLRPLFRWNHNWAIARAKEGLEPAALRDAAG